MDSSNEPKSICLNAAIDHRIRRLFRPVPRPAGSTSRGAHADHIAALGRGRGLDEDEVRVTTKLAEPSSTGGIAVVLQQPRPDHPFVWGIEAVVDDCVTLTTLRDSFATASCNTLDIIDDISIVDLLPYVTEQDMEAMDSRTIRDAFRAIFRVLFQKKPDIVLCAGTVRVDDELKGQAWKVESLGVSKTFRDPCATLYGGNRETVSFQRVNGFHPSTAMNYFPEHSCLRQLLMLEIAHTCALFRHDWEEETWMREFRVHCEETFRERRDYRKYIPDYSLAYSDKIQTILTIICNIASEPGDTRSGIVSRLYNSLMNSRLSEHCNDASLMLGKLSELVDAGWSPRYDKENENALTLVMYNTQSLSQTSQYSGSWLGSARLRTTILGGIESLSQCILNAYGRNMSLDLEQASKVFIETAEALETILWDIIQEGNGEPDNKE